MNIKILNCLLLLFLLGPAPLTSLYANSLTIYENGDVEIQNDSIVRGNLVNGGEYSAWSVGQYYSIPYANRTIGWDFYTTNFHRDSWVTVDLSNILPAGTKRGRVLLDVTSGSGASNKLLLEGRPFGETSSQQWGQRVLILYQGEAQVNGNLSRVAVQAEIDVNDGKFEIKEYKSTWDVGEVRVAVYGFYKQEVIDG